MAHLHPIPRPPPPGSWPLLHHTLFFGIGALLLNPMRERERGNLPSLRLHCTPKPFAAAYVYGQPSSSHSTEQMNLLPAIPFPASIEKKLTRLRVSLRHHLPCLLRHCQPPSMTCESGRRRTDGHTRSSKYVVKN